MAHKYAGVIHAWADGKEIQYRYGRIVEGRIRAANEDWETYLNNEKLGILAQPHFGDKTLEWRIKPETFRYRVALMKGDSGEYWAKLVHHNEDEIKMDIENSINYPNFVKWLTDWVEVKV